jgi:hypothetical protein
MLSSLLEVCCFSNVKDHFLSFDIAKVGKKSTHIGILPLMQTRNLQQRKKERDFHQSAKIPISKS